LRKKIFLNGAIGYDWWTGVDNTATRFIADFAAAEADAGVTEIAIHINSVGGDVHEGLGIYNTIKAATKPTVAVIDGVAYSMAAIIALAATKTHIAANGMFMLHNASGMDWGNAKQFRTTAALLDKYDNQLAVGVAAKTGLSLQEVKDLWFNYEDNFFTADEAFGAQLVDEILNQEADLPADFDAQGPAMKIAAQLGNHLKPKGDSWFNKLVSKVANALPKPEPAQAPAPTPANFDEPMILKNTLTALIAFFGVEHVEGDAVVNVQPTEEQLDALNARLAAAATAEAEATRLQAELTAAAAEQARLTAEVERLGNLAGQGPTPPAGNDPVDPVNAGDKPSWIIAAEKAGYTK
jgi:ATP-dependent Clp protease, protease subunit